MQILNSLLNFYLNSSIHVALAVYCLIRLTHIQFDITYDEAMAYFGFYGTITGYNFVKYAGVAKFHHRSLTKSLKLIQVFSLTCFLLLVYYMFQLELKTLKVMSIFGLITFLYAIPLLPKKLAPIDSDNNLRSISGLKIYVIAVVWSGVTVILPVINAKLIMSTDVWIEAIQRFLFVLIIMIPFEIRDMNYDSLKLGTIPQRIGVRKTKLIGILLLIPFFFLEYFKDQLIVSRIIILLLMMVLTAVFVLKSKIKQSKYYSAFWVEGLPIYWLLLTLLIYRLFI